MEKDIVVRIEELMDLFDDDEVTTADKIQRPQSSLDRDAIRDFNIRNPKAGGGMLVQPGFGGTRQGYRSEKAIKAAQQAGNVAKIKERFDRIGKAFIEQDYNALKTLTRPARIAAGAKDAGGILNASDTALLNEIILGNDVKAQNNLAKQLGINRRYMIDTYKEALEFTKAGKSKKSSELRLKRLETQKNIFDEILNNPNATVKSMAKKFNKTEKEIVKQASLLLKNVYDQNVVIGKGEFSDRPPKSWLPDDFNTTDNFLDNFSNIKGLRKVQSENIGTLIRDAFGKGQNPKKYTQALAALSEYNKLVNSLPEGINLDLDHPLSKAFLKGSGVSPEKLLYVTPISREYNRGFKQSLSMAYDKALLNPNRDKKLIKTIENFADTIGVNIGKGSTKKLDFGTTSITKKTQADLAEEIVQNLREQNLARKNLAKFRKTKEGQEIIKQIFTSGKAKLNIPKTKNLKISDFFCDRVVKAEGGRLGFANGTCSLAEKKKNLVNYSKRVVAGDVAPETAERIAKEVAKVTAKVGSKGALATFLGPAGIGLDIVYEVGSIGFDMAYGTPFKRALENNWITGAFTKTTGEEAYNKDLFAKFPEAQPYGRLGEVINRITKIQNTLSTIEGDPASEYNNPERIQALQTELNNLQDEYTTLSRDGKALQEGSSEQIAYNKAKQEFDSIEAAKAPIKPMSKAGFEQMIKEGAQDRPVLGKMDIGMIPNVTAFTKKQLDDVLFNVGQEAGFKSTPSPYSFGLGEITVGPQAGKYSETLGYQQLADILQKDLDRAKTDEIARAGGVANLAGGGIAGLSGGIDEGPQRRSMNPDSEGLKGLLNRVKKQ